MMGCDDTHRRRSHHACAKSNDWVSISEAAVVGRGYAEITFLETRNARFCIRCRRDDARARPTPAKSIDPVVSEASFLNVDVIPMQKAATRIGTSPHCILANIKPFPRHMQSATI
jgi:hypothetical protein